jgi:hypothetical protein
MELAGEDAVEKSHLIPESNRRLSDLRLAGSVARWPRIDTPAYSLAPTAAKNNGPAGASKGGAAKDKGVVERGSSGEKLTV